MTTAPTPLRKDHTLTGLIVPLGYDWQIDAATELLVTLVDTVSVPNVETTLTNGVHYNVSGIGNPAGGNVTPLNAYTAGWKIVITNKLAYEQTADFTNQNSVKPQEVESMGDRLSKQIKQLVETVSRAFVAPIGGGINPSDLITTLIAYVAQAAAAAVTATTQAGIATAQAILAQAWATQAQNAASGINWTKARVASIGANINIAAPGATIDSIAMVAGDRVLLKNQTLPAQNGLYVWNGAAVAMTRTTDMDTWSEVVSKVVQIEEGTALVIDGTKSQADVPYTTTVNTGGTIGVTAITFLIFTPPIPDGAIATAAKIVNGVLAYAHINAGAIATLLEAQAGTVNKLINAAILKSFMDARYITNPQVATVTGSDVDIVDGTGGVSIPANAKRITISFSGVSNSANGDYRIRIGNNNLGFTATGYDGVSTEATSTVATVTNLTGVPIRSNNSAAGSAVGILTMLLTNAATNEWTISGTLTNAAGTQSSIIVNGRKALGASEILDRIRISTTAGAFDAGAVGTLVECW